MGHKAKRTTLLALATLALVALAGMTAGSLDAKPKKGKKKGGPPLATQFDHGTLAEGFGRPITFDFLPDGTMLVGEKAGKIYTVNGNGDAALLHDLSGKIINQRERGLEGIEVASDFASSRRVYFTYAYLVNPANPSGPQALRMSYIRLNANNTLADPANPETVLLGKDALGPCPPVSNKLDCPPSRAATHQGGTVLSAPDGSLFVGFGDTNLPETPGKQVFRTFDPASTAGKLLHIDANGNGLRKHPFCKKDKDLSNTCTKVFARGLRNPFRFTLTPGGDPIVSDVGWTLKEEINVVKAGKNYGWPCFEGTEKTPFYREQARCKSMYKNPGQFTKPVYEYRNNDKLGGGAAIMGPFYPGDAYPRKLHDNYVFGDYAQRFIRMAKLKKGRLGKVRTVATDVFPVQFRLAPNGNVAYVDFINGTVNELVYAPNHAPTPRASASPDAFCPPANQPVTFSSAGTADPEGDPLTYSWNFGDGDTASGATVSHSYPAVPSPSIYTATLSVSDGNQVRKTKVKVFAGDCPPSATVNSPTNGSAFRTGATISLSATASDPDGPPPFLSWDVLLVHKDHRHTLGTFTGSQASFQTATDHDADSYYEITLTATDSLGYTIEAPKVQIVPETTSLKIRSNLGKVKISYAGRTLKTPKTLTAAIGFGASLAAPAEVERGGARYRFKRWSQGGRRVQTYTVPAGASEVRAVYKKEGGGR